MPADHSPETSVPHRVPTAVRSVATAAESVAFWVAVVLPLLYVPLFAVGLVTLTNAVVVGLLTANVVALLLGSRYDRRATGRRG